MAYIDVIVKIFGSVNALLDAVTKSKDLRQGKSGLKNLVLAELELNISLLVDEYLTHNVSEEEIIRGLGHQHIAKAMEDNFDFAEIRRGKVKPLVSAGADTKAGADYLTKLEGLTAEQLFRKIYVKISELKRVETLYKNEDTSKLRLGVRLKNLLKLLMVTAKFIGEKKR